MLYNILDFISENLLTQLHDKYQLNQFKKNGF